MSRKQPVPINKEDFEKMLEEAKKQRDAYWKPRAKRFTPSGERLQDYIIGMCLGFGSGMRISEIFGLSKKTKYHYKMKNVTQVQNKVIITNIPALTFDRVEEKFIRIISGKGKKDRTVPLPSKLFRKAGITRLELKRKLPLKTSYRSMESYITALGLKVLNKHITFHMLRHGFITELLNSGMPTHQVQIFSGHSRLDTLGIYAHANPKDALDKYEEIF